MICLVTDRRRLSSGTDAVDRLVELVEAAVRAGVDLIQVRERDLDARALAALVTRCLAAAEGTGTKVVVNDRADVAAATGAAGVHLRGDSIGVHAARSLLGDGAVIGRSVHSADEARLASEAGVDYLIFGTLFQTSSKDDGHPVATFDQLRRGVRCGRRRSGAGHRRHHGRTSGRSGSMRSRRHRRSRPFRASGGNLRRSSSARRHRSSCGGRLTRARRLPNNDRNVRLRRSCGGTSPKRVARGGRNISCPRVPQPEQLAPVCAKHGRSGASLSGKSRAAPAFR